MFRGHIGDKNLSIFSDRILPIPIHRKQNTSGSRKVVFDNRVLEKSAELLKTFDWNIFSDLNSKGFSSDFWYKRYSYFNCFLTRKLMANLPATKNDG